MSFQGQALGTSTQLPLAKWNWTRADYPRDSCIHELFETQVRQQGESLAVTFEGQQLTYEELNRRSNQLAHFLRKRGVAPDVLVGLCVERSPDMVVGLLGILKAGGAYVPLDPSYPKDRIAYIMADARAPILLTQQSLLTRFPEHRAEVVLLDAHSETIAKESAANTRNKATAESLAYVIYTSGSTGNPKGVQIEHRSVVNFLCSMAERPGLQKEDVLAAVTTLCFDIAGLEIYLPLTAGAQVVVLSREEASDGKKLEARLAQCAATVMQATPATWRLLLEAGWKGNPQLKILCGGEALPRDLARQLLSRCGSLWNMYGPTETTIWSAVHEVKNTSATATVPIGHPIANTQLHILDEHMNPVPVGQEGELYIGGEGLARGYQNLPALTAEKFVPDRFSSKVGARLYKTGDLARYLPDGNVVFLGRIDHQVKIRGFRIELEEIESVLARHPSVHQCVVIAQRQEATGDERLIAYIVASRDQRPVSRILRAFLREKLPDYMLPSAFVVVDAMPVTPNGKVDRKGLPSPSRENTAIDREYVAPRDSVENELVAIWEGILGIRPLGVTDNIFDLGVDSLLAAQLFARVEKTFGKRLPPAPLFQAPTVESFAALLRRQDKSNEYTSLVKIRPQGSQTPLFCVHGGAGTVLLFNSLARRISPDRPVYGLQAQGLYGQDLPHTTISEMAAHYIKEIRTVQPHGPYLLAGWCFGGSVVFEMAQQLVRLGEKVELLAILNATSTGGESHIDPPLKSWGARLRAHRQRIKSLPAAKKLPYLLRRAHAQLVWRRKRLRRRGLILMWRVKRLMLNQLYRYYLDRRRPLPDFLRHSYFLEISARAEDNYVHQCYPGTMVVFRDQGPYSDPQLGWGKWVQGKIEAYEIPVSVRDHRALMQEPAVRIVAQIIEEYVQRHSNCDFPSNQHPSDLVRDPE